MEFTETKLTGAWIVDLEEHVDDRGAFARAFCRDEFRAHGLKDVVDQTNMSSNIRAGTLRGMHYQIPPATETKFIRVVQGALYDVIVDLRPSSSTFGEHVGVELSAENRRAFYVPEMFAHGFVTLEDDTVALYQVSGFYTPGYERGMRHDDPALGIDWPHQVNVISEKDAAWPDADLENALS